MDFAKAWNSRSLAISARISVICCGVNCGFSSPGSFPFIRFPLVGEFVEFLKVLGQFFGRRIDCLGLFGGRFEFEGQAVQSTGNGIG